MASSNRIAIIGAGVSGLSAAVRLVENGFSDITIFEARRDAGGRTRSYIDPHTGDTLDNGQHLLMGCYTSTLEYLKSIGTEKLIDREPLRIPFWSSTGVRSFTIDRSLPPPMNLLSALTRTSLLTFSEKRSAAVLGNAIWRSKLPRDIAGMTCAEFFKALSQPADVVEKLWAPMVLATINAEPEQASAILFVNVIREAFFSSRAASMLLIPRCGLSDLLIEPAIRRLEGERDKKAAVKTGTPVRAIRPMETSIELQLDGETTQFDYIITTIPQLFLDTRNPTPEIQLSPIVNAYFWLDRSILKAPIYAFIGTTLQWVFPKTTVYSVERLALTVSAADNLVEMSNDDIRDLLWSELQQTVPAARDAKLVHSQIIREKRATPLFTPKSQRLRPLTESFDRRIMLAGDQVQNGLPATIEGAIRNGHSAADALASQLKRE